MIGRYERAVVYLGEAIAAMTAAEPQVTSSGREEFGYLRNKTESYQMFFQTLITARRAYLELEKAFRVRGKVDRAEFVRNLDTALNLFGQARMHGRKTAEHFAEVIDHPSDMGVLYRANINLVIGLELAEQTVERVVNFHHGRPYTEPVAWDKIYQEFPVSGSSPDTGN